MPFECDVCGEEGSVINYLNDNIEDYDKVTTVKAFGQKIRNEMCLKNFGTVRAYLLWNLQRFEDKNTPDKASDKIEQMIIDLDKIVLQYLMEQSAKEISKKISSDVINRLIKED